MARLHPFSSADGPGDATAWIGLGLALVALSALGYPRLDLAQPIRLTLVAVILYVLLVNVDAIAPALDRLTRALSDRRPSSGGAGGARLVQR